MTAILRVVGALGRLSAAVLIAGLGMIPMAPAQPEPAENAEFTEAAVKAAFLYHFGTYVTWPEPVASDPVLTIAVLGDDDVFEHLDQYLPGRTISGRDVDARAIDAIEEFDGDEILFIGRSENRRLDDLLEDLAVVATGSLIVTDDPDGIPIDAVANFRVVESRVRFEINREAADRSGLTLSSRLLAAADRVIGAP